MFFFIYYFFFIFFNKKERNRFFFFLIIKERNKQKYRIWKIYHQASAGTKEKCSVSKNTKPPLRLMRIQQLQKWLVYIKYNNKPPLRLMPPLNQCT